MKKTFKPGERFNAFQAKKKKYKSYSDPELGKMPNRSQVFSRTNAPDTKMPNPNNDVRSVVKNIAKPSPKAGFVSPSNFPVAQGNANSTKMMAKKKHSKKMKHRKTAPAGWNQATYNSFKASNPRLEPNSYDTSVMRMGGTQTHSLAGVSKSSNSTQVMKKKKHSKYKKNWIAGAIKKPGALHAELGVKQGNKIPAKTLAKAANKGGKEGKRARLAETLKSFHHKTHKKVMKNDHDADDKMKNKKHMKSDMHCKVCGK